MPFYFFVQRVKIVTNLEYHNYLQSMEPGYMYLVYKCEPQMRVNNKRLLCTNQTRPAIVKEQLEFRESDVSPGQTEVKQGTFIEFITPSDGLF